LASLRVQHALSVETGNVFSLVMQLVCCWAGRECNNQPLTGAAKAIDAAGKSDRKAAGDGWQKGMAARRQKHQQSHDGGGSQIWMADNAAGEGQQTTQHPTINRSAGGMVTLAKAAVIVTIEAKARAWWWQQWRQ
jgi:hypothetical protein